MEEYYFIISQVSNNCENKNISQTIFSSTIEMGECDYEIVLGKNGDYFLRKKKHELTLEEMRKKIFEDIYKLTCEQITKIYHQLGVFQEHEKVFDYNVKELGEVIDELNQIGYNVFLEVEQGHDHYFLVNCFEGIAEARIYGLSDEYEEWCNALRFYDFIEALNAADTERVTAIYTTNFKEL